MSSIKQGPFPHEATANLNARICFPTRKFLIVCSFNGVVVLEASDMDDQTQPSAEANSDQAVEIDLSNTVLDLTSFQLHDLDSVELSTGLTELDLTANRLSSLDSRISHLSNLKKLSFRQNLIHDAAIEPISRWDELSGLEVLFLLHVISLPR